ncbi:hypothetical protein LZQ00_17040 [Sphingobacterium sp. SRCM116780]|uniref:hypothetical protein n=1 Tax=Sphingobacterium sp. SRCM116780 TaxID=2907623 RepID=UPI001F1CBE13|nr:hypothetical protein [Sphingobacterium sp. SRCM116780]UIR55955.1 hypothetical protein LZQ00_17040 [Sphingobacterium sp. SRCM116780]
MKIKHYVFAIFFFIINWCGAAAQEKSVWFYPWETDPAQLVNDNSEFIPVNKNGINYRIVRIDKFEGSIIQSIQNSNSQLDVSVSELPLVKNYKGTNIIDPVLPIGSNYQMDKTVPNSSKYFLIRLKGKIEGKQRFSITIKTDKVSYTIDNTAIVSDKTFARNLNLNVWAYFDYNFMLKGASNEMENLQALGVDVLLIPPYVLPHVSDVSKPNSLIKYLKGSEKKFKYYIIYFGGFQAKSNSFCSTDWFASYSKWIRNLTTEMNGLGIRQDQILLYPIDEPKGDNIKKLNDIINFSKSQGIKSDFFSTAENNIALSNMELVKYGQLHTGAGQLESSKISRRALSGNKTWIYETRFGRSRDQSPVNYLRLGWKATQLNASGIGLWNYCDVQNAYSSVQQNLILKGTPSWAIVPSNPGSDYSLVYRKNQSLYSSIRGEALFSALEEEFWLKLYKNKNGDNATNILMNNLISGKVSYVDMEVIKCKLVN